MANSLHFSPRAQIDLDETFDYINDVLKNPIAAKNTIARILESVDILKDFSDVGTKVFFDENFTGYRFITYKNYLSFYRSENTDIFIDRILYSGRDYMHIFFG